MIEYDIERIEWAKNALKTIFISVDDRFDENTPFDEYPNFIEMNSLLRIIKK